MRQQQNGCEMNLPYSVARTAIRCLGLAFIFVATLLATAGRPSEDSGVVGSFGTHTTPSQSLCGGVPALLESPRNHQGTGSHTQPVASDGGFWALDLGSPAFPLHPWEFFPLLSYLLRDDEMVCISIGTTDPGSAQSHEYRSKVEDALSWLTGEGMEGRLVTVSLGDRAGSGPTIGLARRVRPWADASTPDEVRSFITTFLTAWVHRSQVAWFFSAALRRQFGDEELRMAMCGTSNPHHAGYFVHSVVPCEGGWVVVTSLFEHYTGEALVMDPLCTVFAFKIVQEGNRYVAAMPSPEDARAIRWPEDSPIVLQGDGPRLLCPARGDPDGDGVTDTLVLYAATTKPGTELKGAVVESEVPGRVYPLQDPYYLGEGTGCEGPAFRDLDSDGRDEIIIFSGTGAHIHILNVFAWDGSAYAWIGDTGGDIDARIEDSDHDGIWDLRGENGYHKEGMGSPTSIKRVYTSQLRGRQTAAVDEWLEPVGGTDEPFACAASALVSFYVLLNREILSGEDADTAYESTCRGFHVPTSEAGAVDWRRVLSVSVRNVESLLLDADSARVTAMLTVVRNSGSAPTLETWRADWSATRSQQGWKLDRLVEVLCAAQS